MINLLIALLLICGSFGATISKTTNEIEGSYYQSQRDNTEPLKLD